jgi:uncharacterized protein
MPELHDALLLFAMGLAVFLAGLINGVVGMGFAQLMAAGLALIVDPKAAIVLLSITVPITAGMQVAKRRAQARHARRIGRLLVAGLAGVPLGVALLTLMPTRAVALLLGLFTILFVATSIRKTPLRLSPGRERLVAPLVGLTAGICNGALGVSGPILASYLLTLDLPAATFGFTISVLFAALSLLRLASLVVVGEVTPPLLVIGLGLLAPGLVGQQVGFWLHERISQEAFRRGALVLMFVAGLGLLRRGLSL